MSIRSPEKPGRTGSSLHRNFNEQTGGYYQTSLQQSKAIPPNNINDNKNLHDHKQFFNQMQAVVLNK